MKVQNGKIICAKCGKKGVRLISQQDAVTVLQCNHCKRKVNCNTIKVGDALFDVKSMEGESLI